MRNGAEKACALKCLHCTTSQERESALNELEGLYMGRGVPHLVQGLAAFQCYDPHQQPAVIWLATESAPTHFILPGLHCQALLHSSDAKFECTAWCHTQMIRVIINGT